MGLAAEGWLRPGTDVDEVTLELVAVDVEPFGLRPVELRHPRQEQRQRRNDTENAQGDAGPVGPAEPLAGMRVDRDAHCGATAKKRNRFELKGPSGMPVAPITASRCGGTRPRRRRRVIRIRLLSSVHSNLPSQRQAHAKLPSWKCSSGIAV